MLSASTYKVDFSVEFAQVGVSLCEKQKSGFACGEVYWQMKKNKSKIVVLVPEWQGCQKKVSQ